MTRMPPLLMIGSSHFVFSAPRDATAETRMEMTYHISLIALMVHFVQLSPYVIFIRVETFSLPLLKFQMWELLAPDPKKDHGNGIFSIDFFTAGQG